MRKSLFVSLVIVLMCALLLVIGCGNGGGGGSEGEWAKPAWAGDGVFPLIAYDTNGNTIGYVVGVNSNRGWVKLYNEELGKFFEMTLGFGMMRSYDQLRDTGYSVYADANCNPYMYQGFDQFIYYDHPQATTAPLIDAEFYTFSSNPADAVGYQAITKELRSEPDPNDQGQGLPFVWVCYDYDPAYWRDNEPDTKFYPAVEVGIGTLPFDHFAGPIKLSSE